MSDATIECPDCGHEMRLRQQAKALLDDDEYDYYCPDCAGLFAKWEVEGEAEDDGEYLIDAARADLLDDAAEENSATDDGEGD